MTTFTVIGAGLAGLFAAAVLRNDCDIVLEKQSKLPNNHSSLLRFRSSVVGDAVNIPFAPVDVIKSVVSLGNPVADAIAYSLKTNGEARLRSILSADGKPQQRFIAPTDLVNQLYAKLTCDVMFDAVWSPFGTPSISTIPMPALAELLGYDGFKNIKFGSVSGYSIRAKVKDCDLCASVYFPDQKILPYRASITHDQLIIEFAFPKEPDLTMSLFERQPMEMRKLLDTILPHFGMDARQIAGVPTVHKQSYGKILPIDDHERKRFILWASEKHNVYSFGRFATWRPGLLMDDLVEDLRVIQRLAGGASSYDARKGK